jgi:hypothetical protein
MSIFLLTGAGFSRNWGGWLADEAFGFVLQIVATWWGVWYPKFS